MPLLDLIGQLYVEKYFKPEAKVRMLELVNNLQSTFGERIKRLDWMSDEDDSLLAEYDSFESLSQDDESFELPDNVP